MDTYTIKPLEWKGETDTFGDERYTAETCFATFNVYKNADDPQWRWDWCISEYHDEGYCDCESLEDGKQKAEAYWISRIMPALEPAKKRKN